jgi:hypothetical protein
MHAQSQHCSVLFLIWARWTRFVGAGSRSFTERFNRDNSDAVKVAVYKDFDGFEARDTQSYVSTTDMVVVLEG